MDEREGEGKSSKLLPATLQVREYDYCCMAHAAAIRVKRAAATGLRIFSRVGYLEFLEGWDSRKHHPPTHPILWSIRKF